MRVLWQLRAAAMRIAIVWRWWLGEWERNRVSEAWLGSPPCGRRRCPCFFPLVDP